MDLALFNSYELANVRDRMLATARENPKTPWGQAYRRAAASGLIALRKDRVLGVWGCPHWLEKNRELRSHIAETITNPPTTAAAANAIQKALDQRLTLDSVDPY